MKEVTLSPRKEVDLFVDQSGVPSPHVMPRNVGAWPGSLVSIPLRCQDAHIILPYQSLQVSPFLSMLLLSYICAILSVQDSAALPLSIYSSQPSFLSPL